MTLKKDEAQSVLNRFEEVGRQQEQKLRRTPRRRSSVRLRRR